MYFAKGGYCCIVGGGAFGAFIPYPEFWQEPLVPIYFNMLCYHLPLAVYLSS